ncbi:antibiotic biosynthesis monooxygenase family protein [Rothia halotolerans]|uniref:antibiotic biosynthesis monooxygenase family protein n=1 Tax=Rothia halotolerans TaxID=405770 RepID=UPI00101D1891|nr:antibiotic biosynthesis monooxygenase [Rothia halotolerans]
MTFVNITALTFPEGAEAEIEKRFAARKKGVDAAEGFQGFELLRPRIGESRYFVTTRWDSRESYEKWSAARPAGNHGEDERRGMSVEVLGFDVVPLEETDQG